MSSESKPSLVRHGKNLFHIERGQLQTGNLPGTAWTLKNRASQSWLERVELKQLLKFDDVAEIKVGIKTTADKVFIRDRWNNLAPDRIPESQFLRPLITHRIARKWNAQEPELQVLYPYLDTRIRTPIDLRNFPGTSAYLNTFKEKLCGREYLISAGRKWFEIWVPQQPCDWSLKKIVWPDISEQPAFFMDESGAIVNGDCYWLKLKAGQHDDWLYLMLAVANSSLAIRFYDYKFHNKLYGGRRRFMTQYVKNFPLPDLENAVCQKIVAKAKALKNADAATTKSLEEEVEQLISEAFGIAEFQF